jgi:leukotriene-A4 hydrolase
VDRGEQERALGANDLKETLARLERDDDKTLLPELAGRDPDENVTDVPYERGALFLAYLEAKFGRETFDAFLRRWFDAHAFKSVTTPQFLAFLQRELLAKYPDVVSSAQIDAWLRSPTMPEDTVWPQSQAFARVDAAHSAFVDGTPAAALDVSDWSTRQWQYFLDGLPEQLAPEQLAALDEAFGLSTGRNAAIAARWFCVVARNGYAPAYAAMEQHLRSIGRMLLIVPVYRELAKTDDGRAFAQRVFAQSRAGLHPIAQDAIARALAPPA